MRKDGAASVVAVRRLIDGPGGFRASAADFAPSREKISLRTIRRFRRRSYHRAWWLTARVGLQVAGRFAFGLAVGQASGFPDLSS
ncbi:hypothetical protein LAC81_12585 [Ensifer adhaerens]|uniref:hypothetical protein n=1 Tax=Ensifer adhaerens TaxID=106592 RepID=UPI001CBC5AF5|nr:hypothetical protein [Ensifer adhaerens]MBZ7922626.1 hypothetical protein [Ensifer adhaerens]UAX91244.1 hypothetical protein LAC78_12580 [Ensifer adhaerens]UAX98872.1 hypothetical protein LAC80_12585 [Ensifer adhaerens]UAY06255.1 hypothetical protein LAC81_12585 [Ensifer adhaerens]